MKVFSLYMHDYTGDDVVEVFQSEEKALEYVKSDIQDVLEILDSDKYKGITLDRAYAGEWEVYVPNSGIYYEWKMYESTLR